jgi:hypothetical protein
MMAAGGLEMLAALETSRLAEAIRGSVWTYPLLETAHIASFAALIGSVLLFELRVFGVARAIGVVPLARLALRTALIAFACAAISGALLFIPSATELAAHPAFQVKLVLILIAGLNAAVFHLRGGVRGHDAVARLQAMVSLVLLLAVLAAGRLIAYL